MSAETTAKKGLTGWHVLIITAIAFGLVFAVNITFVVLSLKTFTGEDVTDAYDRGLAYNEVLEERAAQAELGWTARLNAALDEDGLARLTINLSDAAGAPVTGAEVNVLFRRSTHDGEDTTVPLTETGDGTYVAVVALPGLGQWDVRGRAERDAGEALDFEDRLWLE